MILPILGAVVGVASGINQANEENRARNQQYSAAVTRRAADWMRQLSIAGAERVQYDIASDNVAIAQNLGEQQLQDERNELIAELKQSGEKDIIDFLEGSGDLAASGRTGRSIDRRGALEFGVLGRKRSRGDYALTKNQYAMTQKYEALIQKAKANRASLFANVMWQRTPDFEPPRPVHRNNLMPILTGAIKGYTGGQGINKALQGGGK